MAVLLLMPALTATAQTALPSIEVGVKGGATFTHGSTTIPGQQVGSVTVPDLKNQNNGIGYGYSEDMGSQELQYLFYSGRGNL